MAKRIKPEPNIERVTTPAEVNTALAELAELKRQAQAIEAEMNAAIDAAKGSAELALAPVRLRVQALEAGLTAYGEFHRGQFEERRSKEFMFGTIGWRKSTELKTAARATWKSVLEQLKTLRFISAIRTKEEVNKDDLATWPDERLALVGVQRVERDSFWYELKSEPVEEAS